MELGKKIELLKSQLKSLQTEYIETKSEYAGTKDSLKHVLDTLEKDENFELKMKLIKEVFSKELEFMMTRVRMIKKIAPKTSNRLEKEVNDFEKRTMGAMRAYEKVHNEKPENTKGMTEILTDSFSFEDDKVSATIDWCLSSIQETLEKLEKLK